MTCNECHCEENTYTHANYCSRGIVLTGNLERIQSLLLSEQQLHEKVAEEVTESHAFQEMFRPECTESEQCGGEARPEGEKR